MGLVTYDRAKYHYESGNYPSDLDEKYAFTITGMFLGWIIDRKLFSEEFEEDFEEEIESFKNRKITGPEVYQISDGVLNSEMLNMKGNNFTKLYFDFKKGKYLKDFSEVLGNDLPSLYHVEDNWENYKKLKKVINQRYRKWKQNRKTKKTT